IGPPNLVLTVLAKLLDRVGRTDEISNLGGCHLLLEHSDGHRLVSPDRGSGFGDYPLVLRFFDHGLRAEEGASQAVHEARNGRTSPVDPVGKSRGKNQEQEPATLHRTISLLPEGGSRGRRRTVTLTELEISESPVRAVHQLFDLLEAPGSLIGPDP